MCSIEFVRVFCIHFFFFRRISFEIQSKTVRVWLIEERIRDTIWIWICIFMIHIPLTSIQLPTPRTHLFFLFILSLTSFSRICSLLPPFPFCWGVIWIPRFTRAHTQKIRSCAIKKLSLILCISLDCLDDVRICGDVSGISDEALLSITYARSRALMIIY